MLGKFEKSQESKTRGQRVRARVVGSEDTDLFIIYMYHNMYIDNIYNAYIYTI